MTGRISEKSRSLTVGPFGKSIAGGIAVGGGAGALLGAIGGGCNGNDWCFFSRGGTALIGLIVDVAFGAVAGTVVGATRHSHKLIYDSGSQLR